MTVELVEWLKEVLGEIWVIEVRDNEIVAKFEDGEEYEKIEIEVDDRKVYHVYMEYASRTDEIPICDSCHDSFCEECLIFERCKDDTGEEVDAKKLDEYFREETEKHLNQPKYELKDLFNLIVVRPIIIERKCYLDIPHYHYYKGKGITAKLYGECYVKALIILRDFFYSLIKTF